MGHLFWQYPQGRNHAVRHRQRHAGRRRRDSLFEALPRPGRFRSSEGILRYEQERHHRRRRHPMGRASYSLRDHRRHKMVHYRGRKRRLSSSEGRGAMLQELQEAPPGVI